MNQLNKLASKFLSLTKFAVDEEFPIGTRFKLKDRALIWQVTDIIEADKRNPFMTDKLYKIYPVDPITDEISPEVLCTKDGEPIDYRDYMKKWNNREWAAGGKGYYDFYTSKAILDYMDEHGGREAFKRWGKGEILEEILKKRIIRLNSDPL